MKRFYGAESRDGVNVKCVKSELREGDATIQPVRQSQRCAPARPLPRQRAAALRAGMTKNSRAIFYRRTPAPSDDHAVLWYLPTCPEMRGLRAQRTPPQTLLTLPRRSFCLTNLAHPSHSAGPSSFACQPRAELLHSLGGWTIATS